VSRILVLGGTGEGLALARCLGPDDIYSVAGLGKRPEGLACTVREGGFGGADGLAHFIVAAGVGRVVDATHPYAAQISANAREATFATGTALWALRRPAWSAQPGDDWRMVDDWDGIVAAIAPFRRALFTLGREPLQHLDEIPASQYWTVRCLDARAGTARARVLADRGPFALAAERELFERERFDVIVSKNSGGVSTEAKLEVARERGLPVVMLRRPALPEADRTFHTVEALLDNLS
jgi:precorrin-6A/cobalt-precorrin-6A reductase